MAMGIINGYQLGGVDMPTIAQEYSMTTQYEVGDYIVKGDSLYRCIATTVGNFDITKWQLTNMGADVKAINSNLTELEDDVSALEISVDKLHENKLLWSGSGTTQPTSLTLDEAYTNFKFLRFVFYINSDCVVREFPTNVTKAFLISETIPGQNAAVGVTPTNSTTFSCNYLSASASWVLHPFEIYGIDRQN